MIEKRPIDAVLKNAYFVGSGSDRRLVGNIFADTKSRFNDGDVVTTSTLTAQYGDVYYTRNTVYYIASYR